mmetsp:Transcript_5890/g.23273  ORF Transcript_5890/g.23273 Transcript_5890/m.23273 type:complete len:206 (-) Transcript_5890:766-1383(-)
MLDLQVQTAGEKVSNLSTPVSASHQLLHAPISFPRLSTGIFREFGFGHVVTHRERTREDDSLARHETDDAGDDGGSRVAHQRCSQQTEVHKLADNYGGKFPSGRPVELCAFGIASEQTDDVADLERHLQQRKGQEHVPVLEAVVPRLGTTSVETQERHGGVHVLIHSIVVAVNVVAHLVVVSPHQRRAADEIVRQTEDAVDGGRR